ncbi:GPR endopeptidase [Faecalibacillus sp. MSK20_93]|uniref:GPR endopeptidase n=1 Tax=Faecalibacillus sp. MSK20_93 TaxID=2884903 RepID=UPI001D09EE93|nr:GPR endopeptidase [Faecalibacillus sp. MSK20_93]MCB7509619.1 GPR endopeptidase [bacterium MSK20_81]MCB8549173.1 GPR endopeptidase [Faecalibacillus sp. MSK20_93]
MNKYNTHSDLAKESLELLKEGKHYKRFIEKMDNFSIETYEFLEDTDYLKKGKYIEIFFKESFMSISQHVTRLLKEMIDQNDYPRILIIGLGNPYLTSDAIGPRTLRDIRVTHYLDDGLKLENHYYDILSLTPGVMYQTGVETVEVIQAMVDQFQIDLVIAIDALCARDYQKLGRVIQINNVGIHPGSGIGNHRQAIQEETLGCPVIAIGVPTVIYASSIVRDVFQLMKDYFGDALDIKNKLKIGKRKKYEGELSVSQQQYLLGHVGSLEQEELESLLYEILTPVDRNFVMSDKQIDETVEKVSAILSKALNDLRYNS